MVTNSNLAPPDPNVILPPAVRAAAKRSEELIAASRAAPVTVEGNNPQPQPTPPLQPQPQPAPQPEPQPSPPQPQALSQAEWEQRFNSMKGRYDQADKIARQQATQLADMQRLLAVMHSQPASQPQPAPGDVRFTSEPLITDKERKEFGDEFLDVAGRRAREVITPEIAALRAEVAALKTQVGGVTQAVVIDSRQKVLDALDRNIPNWREINVSQEFKSWLGLRDAYSGAIRLDLLKQAFDGSDIARVEAFFHGYIADVAATRPAGELNPNPSALPSGLDLAALAAPGRARQAAGANPPPEKPVFTRAQISTFYRDVNRGVYAGRDDERIAMEKTILLAANEGRVR